MKTHVNTGVVQETTTIRLSNGVGSSQSITIEAGRRITMIVVVEDEAQSINAK